MSKPRPTWQFWILAAAAVLVVLGVLYPGPLLNGEVFLSADDQSAAAFRQVGDRARADGDYPLWNPYIFGGMPTFGSLAYTRGLYPPTAAFEFLQTKLGFPPLTWMLGHLFFGGLGMVWLLGRWQLPWGARILGAVAFLAFPRLVAWGVHGHGTKLGSTMYLPWIVGLTWEILTTARLRPVGWLALLLGLQFLRHHVQISYYTLLFVGWLAVWHLVWPLDGEMVSFARRTRRTGWLALAVILGFMIGGVMLLPVHDYAGLSTRGQADAAPGGSAYEYATAWSLAPDEIPTLVVPGAAGFGKATYMGRMPFTDYPNTLGWLLLGLAAAAWLAGRRSLVVALTGGSLICLLIALGNHSPGLHQLFYAALPYFDKFRVPSMILILVAFSMSVLASYGAAILAALPETRLRPLTIAALLAGGLGALLVLAAGTGAVEGSYLDSLRAMAARSGKQAADVLLTEAWRLHRALLIRSGLVLLAAGGALFFAARSPSFRTRGLVWVLAVLVVVELRGVDRLIVEPQTGLWQVAADAQGRGQLVAAGRPGRPYVKRPGAQVNPALADALRRTAGHGRVYPLAGEAQSNEYMTVGVRSLGGYYPAKPAAAEAIRSRLFARPLAGRLAGWLAGGAVTFAQELPPEAFEVFAASGLDLDPQPRYGGDRWVYANRAALPRARLQDRFVLQESLTYGDGLATFLDAITTGEHDPAAAVMLAAAPQPLPETGVTALPEPEIVRDGLNEVLLRTGADRPALLLLADLTAPGWRVEVDGEKRPLLRADWLLRAVALPGGDHEVRFVYHDPAVGRGLVFSLVGAAGALALILVRRRTAKEG